MEQLDNSQWTASPLSPIEELELSSHEIAKIEQVRYERLIESCEGTPTGRQWKKYDSREQVVDMDMGGNGYE